MSYKTRIKELIQQAEGLSRLYGKAIDRIIELNDKIDKLKRKKCPNCGFVACDKHSKQCADIDEKLKEMERRE